MNRCRWPRKLFHQFRRVVQIFAFADTTGKVPFESCLAPWALRGVADGSEGRHGAELFVTLNKGREIEGQSSVPSHRVTEN